MKHVKNTDDEVFAILERCAIEGKRCPENSTHGVGLAIIPNLARAGRIRIEISGRNYRQVFLLTGRHKGRSTAPNPTGHSTWKIVDTRGTRVNGKRFDANAHRRPQPSSLPRF